MSERDQIVKELREAGIVAVVRTPSANAAVEVVQALHAGGVVAAEVTFTVPDAAEALRQVKALADAGDLPGLILGAGTVITREQAEAAVDAGARYLVSPHLARDVVDVAIERGVAALPGALTPGEVYAARAAGADVVKIFPAARMGPSYLKDLSGPYPDIPLMPTGGVNAGNVGEWLAAGAVAVGVGSELVHKPAVAAGDWGEITRRAADFAAAFRRARDGQ